MIVIMSNFGGTSITDNNGVLKGCSKENNDISPHQNTIVEKMVRLAKEQEERDVPDTATTTTKQQKPWV